MKEKQCAVCKKLFTCIGDCDFINRLCLCEKCLEKYFIEHKEVFRDLSLKNSELTYNDNPSLRYCFVISLWKRVYP